MQILSSTLGYYLLAPRASSSRMFVDTRAISTEEQGEESGKAPGSHSSVQQEQTLPRTLFLCTHLNHHYQFSSSRWQQLQKFKTHGSIKGTGGELEENSERRQFCLDINSGLRGRSSHFSVGCGAVHRSSSKHVCSSQLPPVRPALSRRIPECPGEQSLLCSGF